MAQRQQLSTDIHHRHVASGFDGERETNATTDLILVQGETMKQTSPNRETTKN